MTLIAPGTYIEPLDEQDYVGPGIFRLIPIHITKRPYLCTDLVTTDVDCPKCKANAGVWLEVKDYPGIVFCATHWKALYRPVEGAFDDLLITTKDEP